MWIVTVQNKGEKFWLRGTTWAFNLDRANKFETREAAAEAAKRAEKFMAPAIRRGYVIEEVAP